MDIISVEAIRSALQTAQSMRRAQKQYFATRSGNALTEAKELEAKTDKLLDDALQLCDKMLYDHHRGIIDQMDSTDAEQAHNSEV